VGKVEKFHRVRTRISQKILNSHGKTPRNTIVCPAQYVREQLRPRDEDRPRGDEPSETHAPEMARYAGLPLIPPRRSTLRSPTAARSATDARKKYIGAGILSFRPLAPARGLDSQHHDDRTECRCDEKRAPVECVRLACPAARRQPRSGNEVESQKAPENVAGLPIWSRRLNTPMPDMVSIDTKKTFAGDAVPA
jgi:hypothetical protein